MSRRTRTGWIVLVVLGTLATVGSAVFGLLLLRMYLLQAEELDGRAPPPVLAPGEKGPLLRLGPGQSAQVYYRSQGCFHWIYRVLTFARDDHGMNVDIHGTEPWERQAIDQRALTEAEVVALDRELLYAEKARGGGCTTRHEYNLIVFEGDRAISHTVLVDDTCGNPAFTGEGLTFDALAREWKPVPPPPYLHL